MHLTCTLRARAISQLPDIRIQFFQLISSIPCQDSLCQLRRKSRNFSKRARMHLTCILRARAITQLPDIWIQFFQLISSIPYQDSLCQLRRKSRNLSKPARTHNINEWKETIAHVSCVHGPCFGPLTLKFNFSNWSCLIDNVYPVWELTMSV